MNRPAKTTTRSFSFISPSSSLTDRYVSTLRAIPVVKRERALMKRHQGFRLDGPYRLLVTLIVLTCINRAEIEYVLTWT